MTTAITMTIMIMSNSRIGSRWPVRGVFCAVRSEQGRAVENRR